jgi:NADH-quinone oxidoreductase subunit N
MPPTGGFTAKLILFTQLFGISAQSDLPWLYHTALWVAVASIGVSIYYYLAIPYRLWFKSGTYSASFSVGAADYALMIVLVLLSILPFFNPNWIIAR